MNQAAAGGNKRVPYFCLRLTVLIIGGCRGALVHCGIQWSVSASPVDVYFQKVHSLQCTHSVLNYLYYFFRMLQ